MNIDTINEVGKAQDNIKKEDKKKQVTPVYVNLQRLGLAAKLAQEFIFASMDLVHSQPGKEYVETMKFETKRHYALLTNIEYDLMHPGEENAGN